MTRPLRTGVRAAPSRGARPDAPIRGPVRAPGRNPVRALDILLADDTLRASYLLQVAGNTGAPALDEEIATRFLLWFAVDGRHKFQQIVFSPDYLAFLAAPAPPFATRLAAHVQACRRQPPLSSADDIEAFHAWYYVVGVRELHLTPLLVASERHFLAEDHPRLARHGPKASRWDYFRFLAHLGERPAAFRQADLEQQAFAAWLAAQPATQPAAQPADGAAPWHAPPPLWDLSGLPGINVIGSADGVSGIGEDARALSDVLHAAGVPYAIFNVRYPAEIVTTAQSGREARFADRPIFPVNVFCLPAFETARLKLAHGENLFAGRYNVGYWPWELSSLPSSWRFAFDLVDEIWASSRFLIDVYQRLTAKPVVYMPPHVGVADIVPFDRESLGLSRSDVIFLCMFDFNSYIARKNPLAAIDAFRMAFRVGGPERLLIKTISGHANPRALLELQRYIADDERITLIDGGLTRSEICGLLQGVDGYVSLHRSEGFGRIIAEAMLLGTPVIATDWSGSASFLNAATGLPVACTLRRVRADEYIYSDGSVWAEPSVEDAARKMQAVRHDPHGLAGIRSNAARVVRRNYGLEPAASRLHDWLTAFSRRRPHKA
jgi:glycosyltransferase involved in cell wall biosynthesis